MSEKKIKKILKNNEVSYGDLSLTLCGHSISTPDKQLNRQVFFFMNFFLNDEVPRPVEL